MFRRLRIALLLYLLAFVAVGNYLTSKRSTDWNDSLWVDVYPVVGDNSEATLEFVAGLRREDFDGLEEFFAGEAERFGVPLARPFRLALAPPLETALPELPARPSAFDAVLFSLRMRWLSMRIDWASDRPTPDIKLFAVYHDAGETLVLERSSALRKGLIAIANVFATRQAERPNQVVMAHELLHTLGATDKYSPVDLTPMFPEGYADARRKPLHPQTRAEIMAGRIALSPTESRIPDGLQQVVVGSVTATEIGWMSP